LNKPLSPAPAASVDEAVLTRENAMASMRQRQFNMAASDFGHEIEHHEGLWREHKKAS
jgi:hypothetical protein